MPLFADQNLYPGVNAHLNSYLQTSKDGMWEPFHFYFIAQLTFLLNKILPPPYDVLAEKSLQIGEYELEYLASVRKSVTKSDVTIFHTGIGSDATTGIATANIATPAMYLPLENMIDDEEELTSVVIYSSADGQVRPVTRIEVLSPSNKPGHSHYEKYIGKRIELLKAGLRIVEIDLLHHSKPMHPALPVYSDPTNTAAPYVILVHDPRPTFEQGQTAVYPVGVLDPLPIINIPLEGADVVAVDFGVVYGEAFALRRFRSQVDYDTDPPAFDRFTPHDQQAIRTLLESIRRQHQKPEP
jgi:hypothetical protein